MLTKYGYNTLGVISIVVFVLFALGIFLSNPYIKYTLIVIGVFLLVFSLNFFSDPDRTIR
jgi:hypothetical protein